MGAALSSDDKVGDVGPGARGSYSERGGFTPTGEWIRSSFIMPSSYNDPYFFKYSKCWPPFVTFCMRRAPCQRV